MKWCYNSTKCLLKYWKKQNESFDKESYTTFLSQTLTEDQSSHFVLSCVTAILRSNIIPNFDDLVSEYVMTFWIKKSSVGSIPHTDIKTDDISKYDVFLYVWI